MASNDGNVAALEAKDSNNHDNAETSVATSTPATTTDAPETAASENIAPSSSIEPVAETTTTAHAQVESVANTESRAKENNDTEIEDKSTPFEAAAPATAPAAESTAEDIPAATVIATPSTATQPSVTSPDVPKTDAAEAAKITEEGEASDQSQPAKETAEEAGPELVITLLLTTGARHPFRIDRKYLKRRSVKVENDDPFNMSVYTLKELIWREWRSGKIIHIHRFQPGQNCTTNDHSEWEPQPSSPSSIRLISFGKLLDDKSPLSGSSISGSWDYFQS